jgi:hypothetical protein
MSLVDRHAMGMQSSVMRALKHMEAHALPGQRVGLVRCSERGLRRSHIPIGGITMTTAIETRVERTTLVGRSTVSACRSNRRLDAYRLADLADFFSDRW